MPKLQSIIDGLAILIFALFVEPAFAARFEFEVTRNGARVADAEVCLFTAHNAENPFDRYLASNDLHCLTADAVLEIPPGKWNFFARHSAGLLSADPGIISIDAPYRLEAGYQRVEVPVEATAELDFTDVLEELEPGEHMVAFYPEGVFGPSVHPLPDQGRSMLILADSVVLPLIVRDRRVRRILSPVRASASTRVSARDRETQKETVDVVAWLRLESSVLPYPDIAPEEAVPHGFEIIATSGSRSVTPLLSTPKGAAAHMNFVIFLGVPKGNITIVLRGTDWVQDEVESTGDHEAEVVNILGPLIARSKDPELKRRGLSQ